LEGVGHNCTALEGKGYLQLRNANIYELPVMVSLLKILSIKPPDPSAFSQCDANFHIQGEHVYFDKLDFRGDAISLLGKGEMNFQGDTRMILAATVGHADAVPPALRTFFSRVGEQFLQIRVSGNLQNPEITKEVLPAANQALEKLDSISRSGM
jgi:hypothetical protein